ncbi:iron-sulfur cluster biosynthesis family protein [Bacillus sp. FJAT-50079]|uniref:iron-sulfur cluster biosynthesis family protein n=1 Tax=Bacillus sp. FJAT-50079 TaxID=2833577 RepID=UPI001BC98C7E|nr:iron-sulfur cluster biosynthesis family protein [Bacillus sp. FJAT-50079]MBS4209682.1 iron-sulfur cluster biosynthesis family protein [Bacillus sp. FJAT-50079]
MVSLTITPEATEKIKEKMVNDDLILKLKYETDGCGCAVNGVPTLQLIRKDAIDSDDIQIETGGLPIIMENSKMIFFDDELKIDFSPGSHTFRLSSPNQILNGHMSCTVKTN